jgi:iron(III) transport system ATP-binding protein
VRAPRATAALEVRGLGKRFGATVAADDVSFDVGPADILCLVGPSGCGKSSVLRMIAGLLEPDAGTIRVGGRVLDGPGVRVPPEKRGIGIVFQDHALFPNLTVGGNVGFGLRRWSRGATRERVAEVLALVDLPRHADRYPHELSGGERQRVALARALAPEPTLLLLDEPFASLDPNLRAQVRADVVAILRRTGTPSVFVTHDQLEALSTGDHVAVMRAGRIEQLDEPAALFHTPRNHFVARFMGQADFLPVARRGGLMVSEIGTFPDGGDNGGATGPAGTGDTAEPAGECPGEAEIMVRPEDVTFEARPDGEAEVVFAEFQGSSWLYGLRLASGTIVHSRRSHTVEVPVGARACVALVGEHPPVVMPGG